MPARPIAFCCDLGKGHNHLAPECQKCQPLSAKMDVYVVGQRLLNFYDQQVWGLGLGWDGGWFCVLSFFLNSF
jgi:hypothetical protein